MKLSGLPLPTDLGNRQKRRLPHSHSTTITLQQQDDRPQGFPPRFGIEWFFRGEKRAIHLPSSMRPQLAAGTIYEVASAETPRIHFLFESLVRGVVHGSLSKDQTLSS